MTIPLIVLLILLVSIVLLAIPVKGVMAEVAKAFLLASALVLTFANIAVHVIRF